ncbi:hypothetical protein DUI87_19981 [Hirundo rustica rustica]|uniref:Reverse transcriptase domain-containing protein n=1 Tax=Hirundo rustica rustica TaxID=333673 RepID=A0A3M0JVL2_HIRRU|nr:hypothetical protein DUI87_19981 [Hirundo rustica rustica]
MRKMPFLPQNGKTSCSLGTQPPELEDRDREQNETQIIQREINICSVLHKSMGPDGIHLRVLRGLVAVLMEPPSITSQQFWLTRKVPGEGKFSVHSCKKGWKEDAGSYGPVSLTSVPGKVTEQILVSAIIQQVQDNQGISPASQGS